MGAIIGQIEGSQTELVQAMRENFRLRREIAALKKQLAIKHDEPKPVVDRKPLVDGKPVVVVDQSDHFYFDRCG